MTRYEYKVVPAPTRGVKAKTARTPEDRFAHALAEVMNALGAEGWDYVRCDALPSEERTGLTGRTTVYRNMLVFRRPLAAQTADGTSTPVAAKPVSFAARVAATLRPDAAAPAIQPAAAPSALRAATDLPAPGPVRPIGPAERGAPGDAPRLSVEGDLPDDPRARIDGQSTG